MKRSLSLLLYGSLLLLASSLGAQEAQPQSKLDPQAQAVVDQMMTAYKSLPALREKVAIHLESNDTNDPTPTGDFHCELRLKRPNKFWYRGEEPAAKGKKLAQIIVCDGKNLWRWRSDTNTYTQSKAPTALTALASPPDITPDLDILFAGKNPFANFTPPVSFTLGTPTAADGLDVEVIEGKIEERATRGFARFFVGKKDHLFRGMALEMGADLPDTGKTVTIKVTAAYQPVDTAPAFTAADFTFTPPPGAKPAHPAASKKPKTQSSVRRRG